jgi:hypothetical protein
MTSAAGGFSPRAGDDAPQSEAELHLALADMEALLLLRVHVGAGTWPSGESSISSFSPLVSRDVCRNVMRSPLTGLWMIGPV